MKLTKIEMKSIKAGSDLPYACSAWLTCPDGRFIMCSSFGPDGWPDDCSSGEGWISCGGKKTYCIIA